MNAKALVIRTSLVGFALAGTACGRTGDLGDIVVAMDLASTFSPDRPCIPTNGGVEICDGIDNDCNGLIDDQLPPRPCYEGPSGTNGIGACRAGSQTCSAGAWTTCTREVLPASEICNGIDDDCNGRIDDGNPGGGTSCDISVGKCRAETACVGGQVLCLGTFVATSPEGNSTNTGTSASPLSTVSAAIGQAVKIGGADVCLCAPAGMGGTISDDVTMVEGVSVHGDYDCATWTPAAPTTIEETAADGLKFPAGITQATVLDSLTVHAATALVGSTSAITITDSSPTISAVSAVGNSAPVSYGMVIRRTQPSAVTPSVLGGAFLSVPIAGGDATAVLIDHASPKFSKAYIGSQTFGPSVPQTVTGLRCIDCGATKITDCNLNSGNKPGYMTTALWGSGDMTGFEMAGGGAIGTNSSPPNTPSAAVRTSRAIYLQNCSGTPLFSSLSDVHGDLTWNTTPPDTWLAIGFDTTGTSCAPLIKGAQLIMGCSNGGGTCIGVRATNSPLSLTDSVLYGNQLPASSSYGLQCLNGGCSRIVNNRIDGADYLEPRMSISGSTKDGAGVLVQSASPILDSNFIAAPNCTAPGTACAALSLPDSAGTYINNILRDWGTSPADVDVVLIGIGTALANPIFAANTIQYVSCGACGYRRGISLIGPATPQPPAGIINDNIVLNASTGGMSWPVYAPNSNSYFASFQNNDLYDLSAQALFRTGGTSLVNVSQVNASVPMASGNISNYPELDLSWHLYATSPCRNAGTASFAPDHDFDGDARPRESFYDIGADEF